MDQLTITIHLRWVPYAMRLFCCLSSCDQTSMKEADTELSSLCPSHTHTWVPFLFVSWQQIPCLHIQKNHWTMPMNLLLPHSFYVSVHSMYSSLKFPDDTQSKENTSEVIFLDYWKAKVALKINCLLLPTASVSLGNQGLLNSHRNNSL